MRHALIYYGGFERNFATLTPGATSYQGSDGATHNAPAWPSSADGLHLSYMEKAGKNFCVVRVADRESAVVLKHELVLEPGQHFGYGVRLSAEPTLVEDDSVVLAMLEEITRKNPEVSAELGQIRARLKAATQKK
jgi:hypothetical protein